MAARGLRIDIRAAHVVRNSSASTGTTLTKLLDVPSLSYQLSFESSTHWSQFYASAPEILKYWQDVASKYDIRKYIKFKHRCVEARWDSEASKWTVTLLKTTDGGASETVCDIETVYDTADVLITGTGTLNEWKWPEIEGLETFRGKVLHSANWDETFDVAVGALTLVGLLDTDARMLGQIDCSHWRRQ